MFNLEYIRLNSVYLSLIGIILRWGFLIWELIFIYCGLFVLILVVFFFFLCCFFFHYVSAKFHLWHSSGVLPRPRIGMLSLVTVSPVITAFHSCCLSHHVFDQVNLWPAWVGFETAIFWQCSLGTVETQRLYPLRHGPRSTIDSNNIYTLFFFLDLSIRLDYLVFYLGTSSGSLGFILVSVSTSVLINGHKDFVWFLMFLFIQFPTSTVWQEN